MNGTTNTNSGTTEQPAAWAIQHADAMTSRALEAGAAALVWAMGNQRGPKAHAAGDAALDACVAIDCSVLDEWRRAGAEGAADRALCAAVFAALASQALAPWGTPEARAADVRDAQIVRDHWMTWAEQEGQDDPAAWAVAAARALEISEAACGR